MKFLPRFEYLLPDSLKEACALLDRYGREACLLAGGTDLLIQLKREEVSPKYLIDIGRIPGLSDIREKEDQVFLGATATHMQVAENELIRREAPFLSEAAASVGSVQIRNSGTIGGNIVNASPAADTIPPLVALNGVGLVVSSSGTREVSLPALFSGPYQTALAPNELLSGVRFKKLSPASGTCFIKLGRRMALSVSRITVAAVLVLDTRRGVREARICPGAVMPMPCRATAAEESLTGELPGLGPFRIAGRLVADQMVRMTGIRPSTSYKEPVLVNLVELALLTAAERCPKP